MDLTLTTQQFLTLCCYECGDTIMDEVLIDETTGHPAEGLCGPVTYETTIGNGTQLISSYDQGDYYIAIRDGEAYCDDCAYAYDEGDGDEEEEEASAPISPETVLTMPSIF